MPKQPGRSSGRGVYLGTALIAFSMLALQITLTRILSVTSWYHLAFFAVSTAMLGMTAGATTVYLFPNRFSGKQLHAASPQRAWALNGIFGVLASVPAVFFSIYLGISTNFYISATCYTNLLVSFMMIQNQSLAANPS